MRFPLKVEVGYKNGKPQLRALSLAEIEWLIEQLNARNQRYRWMAALTIGKYGIDTALPALVAHATDPSWLVRIHIVTAFGSIGAESTAEVIATFLLDQNPHVRRRALTAYGRIARERGVPRILTAVQREPAKMEPATRTLSGFMSSGTAYRLCREAIEPPKASRNEALPRWLRRFITSVIAAVMVRAGEWAIPTLVRVLGQIGDERAIPELNRIEQRINGSRALRLAVWRAIEEIEYRKYSAPMGIA